MRTNRAARASGRSRAPPLRPGRGENGGRRAKQREKAARENRKGAGTKRPGRAKILAGRRAKTTNAGLGQANRALGRTSPTWVSTSQGSVYSFGARLCRNPPARHSYSPLILPTLTAETRFLPAQDCAARCQGGPATRICVILPFFPGYAAAGPAGSGGSPVNAPWRAP